MIKFKILFVLLFILCQFRSVDGQLKGALKEPLVGISTNVFFNDNNGIQLNDGDATNFRRNLFHVVSLDMSIVHSSELFALQVSVPIGTFKPSGDVVNNLTEFNTQLGMMVYPLGLGAEGFSPLIGYKFSSIDYEQGGGATRTATTKMKSTAELGLIYSTPKAYFIVSYNRFLDPTFRLFHSKNERMEATLAKQFFNAGLHLRVASTNKSKNGYRRAKYVDFLSSRSKYLGLFASIGISDAIQAKSSHYLAVNHPYLDSFVAPSRFLTYSVGHHFHGPDVTLSVNYRTINQSRSAFGYEHQINRRSALLELTKYHALQNWIAVGFGGGLTFERIRLQERANEEILIELEEKKLSPFVKIGYEVRPAGNGNWWKLSSSIRYYPFLTSEQEMLTLSHQQVEFNLLQFSFYPGKFALYR